MPTIKRSREATYNVTLTDNPLLRALQSPEPYDHPVGPFKIVETHISWVILTGPFAYKIKKPVNLGFLDFSTLEKRRFYCEEEVRTNRRLCPDLYVDVIPMTGTIDHPILGGNGTPFEYAVKIKQFDEDLLWDRLLEKGELKPEFLDQLAILISGFHQRAPAAASDQSYGMPNTFWKSVEMTFEHLNQSIQKSTDRDLFERIVKWMKEKHQSLAARMIQRQKEGFVREGHGDLHLKNIALFSKENPEILVFDGIEFDENLRWIDVINDIAFLTMDLKHRGHSNLAWRFLNAYLEITGDYKGLDLLRFYEVNRALVRAKVLAIQSREEGNPQLPSPSREFLRLAEPQEKPPRPRLYITHGVSGSGKTTITKKLIETLHAVRIRSDIERKRLFGMSPQATSSMELKETLYGPDSHNRTHRHLRDLAQHILKCGIPVIVDATFLKREDRKNFQELARQCQVDFQILHFQVEENTLRDRIRSRMKENLDASEADLQVLENQIKNQEELEAEEILHTIDAASVKY
ncbi:MAG: hypothetical protein KCHDKBKB_00351 [Elusimicrobia bacterium]|nr:hypothetical protein [Elusimicrobiota bacterium]